jgi:glucosamine--fructose-6-phosphate aminotransferase (isomerizing)
MCGIVGYIGTANAVDVLLPSLKRLEYRGYDSAGVATINGCGLETFKAKGKIANLEALLMQQPPPAGTVGIAHTRWATHGRPSAVNSHPHVDCHGRLAVVHNGIIENHRALRARLVAEGHRFRSETDTEVLAHLIERYRGSCTLREAVVLAARELKGSFAIACIDQDAPDVLVAVRGGGSPLVVGLGDGEAFLASDVPALLGRTAEVLVLEDGDVAALTRDGATVQHLDGRVVQRSPLPIGCDPAAAERGGYPHFMLKEIFEQPDVCRRVLTDRLDAVRQSGEIDGLGLSDADLRAVTRVSFLACGTSWHAALVGKYLIEELARVPVEAALASEYRHREPLFDSRVLTIPVSQSGETADTLAATRQARAQGARVVAITNNLGSSIARDADGVVDVRAGLEIGVAATKTFTAQVGAMALLALKLAIARGSVPRARIEAAIDALYTVPALMAAALEQNDQIKEAAAELAAKDGFLYLGRGLHYPLALEGALKLKEISYVHAEGYAGGEMKHGPIALIDTGTPVVAIAPSGPTAVSMASNIQEVRARGARVVAVTTRGEESITSLADVAISLEAAPYWTHPFVVAVPLQLFAYHLAAQRGADIDQPRNLAKSVTVE